jgi:hypothetical protein
MKDKMSDILEKAVELKALADSIISMSKECLCDEEEEYEDEEEGTEEEDSGEESPLSEDLTSEEKGQYLEGEEQERGTKKEDFRKFKRADRLIAVLSRRSS